MNSQTLREARKYEEAMEPTVQETERPAFHLCARIGWMNDPNGFSFYMGKYHMFYQYYPYSTSWGPMHWGHAVSSDLLHWEYLPAALAPDTWYDKDGCFSGSAIMLPDGRQLLMYTGVMSVTLEDGWKHDVQTQCLAVGDGEDYEKYAKNPVLTEKDLPEGASRFDFRDPKMWKTKNGEFRCAIGNRPADGSGQILLYGSEDGFSWSFRKILAENRNRFGKMWECPDFFSLDGKYVLITSPQDMLPKGFEYHNGDGTLCILGDYDEEKEEFREESDQTIDYGIDFYAPQTILSPDGRRIMIGWMQNWDTCTIRESHEKWFGQMSLPRELSIKNGRLYQQPVRELLALRGRHLSFRDVKVCGETDLEGVKGRKAELLLEIRSADAGDVYKKFSVHFAKNEDYHVTLSFRPYESILKVDRKFSGSRRAIIHQRRCKVLGDTDGSLRLRIILDRYSVEAFVNDGIQVLSASFFTPLEADGITFAADGKALMNLEYYEL